jgi:hypothetical protein
MQLLHDPLVRSSIESRVRALSPDSARQWGHMTVDQMVWHLNQFLAFSLGDANIAPSKFKIPAAVMRFFVLYAPWPKGAPTNPKAFAKERYDLESERARCLALIARFVQRPVDEVWPVDPTWGKVTGRWQSKLQVKHFDHHLKQFGC